MNKMFYADPEMEVTLFVSEDVITTSTYEEVPDMGDGTVGGGEEIVLPDDIFPN